MNSRNRNIAIAALLLGIIAAVSLVFLIHGCSSDEEQATGRTGTTDTSTTAKTVNTAATTAAVKTVTVTTPAPEPSPAPPAPEHGPYMTQGSAVAYVESLGDPGYPMNAIDPAGTWRPDAVLHVIRATSSGSAGYAGDYYFFFVNGYLVGQEFFTYGEPAPAPDDNTFVVSFQVFNPGDPHCCPSGGNATVRFHWDGATLQTLDPMTGATMS